MKNLLLEVLAGIDPGHLINNQVCLAETKLLSSEKQFFHDHPFNIYTCLIASLISLITNIQVIELNLNSSRNRKSHVRIFCTC